MNLNITRRQFLQYCTASAAALGLSQTDLLKLEKALATPQTGCTSPTPSVIWMIGQACSGCQTSLLNRVVEVTGGYYDADMINALYPSIPVSQGTAAGTQQPWNASTSCTELSVVNDVADLLVGDAVGAVVPQLRPGPSYNRGSVPDVNWADDVDLYGKGTPNFSAGYVTLEFLTTVMAGAGDISVDHLNTIVNTGGFVLLMDGSIPSHAKVVKRPKKEPFCFVFDNTGNCTGPNAPPVGPVTVADAVRWIAPQAGAIISIGTCNSFGGIPAGYGNVTGAMPMDQFLAQEGIVKPHIKVPGCPPHPDWIVYPVAYFLIHGLTNGGGTGILDVAGTWFDNKGRPAAMYGQTPQCGFGPGKCPNYDTTASPPIPGPGGAAAFLGDEGCLKTMGCKGQATFGDCPLRQKNTFDDGTTNNWCVGNSDTAGAGIGQQRHPCQGCIEEGFPDWASEAQDSNGPYTIKGRIKGFYNPSTN